MTRSSYNEPNYEARQAALNREYRRMDRPLLAPLSCSIPVTPEAERKFAEELEKAHALLRTLEEPPPLIQSWPLLGAKPAPPEDPKCSTP